MDATTRVMLFVLGCALVFCAVLVWALCRAARDPEPEPLCSCPRCGGPVTLDAGGLRASCPCRASDLPSGVLDDELEMAFALPSAAGRAERS